MKTISAVILMLASITASAEAILVDEYEDSGNTICVYTSIYGEIVITVPINQFCPYTINDQGYGYDEQG